MTLQKRASLLLLLFVVSLAAPLGAQRALAVSSQYSLSLTVIPSVLPADGLTHPAVVVSLLNPAGKPAVAFSDVTVYLTSSDQRAGTIDPIVTIPAGRSYVIANFTTTILPGVTTITASSVGLTTAFATVTTKLATGFPTQLQLYALPAKLPAVNGSLGQIVIESVDDLGLPAPMVGTTVVNATSAASSLVHLYNSSITMKAGQVMAVLNYTVLEPGTPTTASVFITATAPGFVTGFTTVNVVTPAKSGSQLTVQVSASPNKLPSNGKSYTALSVQLQNASGSPAVASASVSVLLTSSSPAVAYVTPVVTIPKGSSSINTTIQTTALAGSTVITAAASNYSSTQTTINTIEPSPSQVVVYISPSNSILTPTGYDSLLVAQLQDGAGNPSNTTHPVQVIVTSSGSSILSQPVQMSIPEGGDYNYTLVSFQSPGTATLTASAQGLQSSQTQVTVIGFPATATVQASPTVVDVGQPVTITLSLQMQGQGLPGATASWSTSAGPLSPLSTTTSGSGTSTVEFTPTVPGVAVIKAQVSDPPFGSWNLTTQVVVQQVQQPTLLQRLTTPPILYVIIAAVVAAAAVVAVFLLRRRGGGEGGEEGGEDIFGGAESA